jgi:predicted transcriptional regulator
MKRRNKRPLSPTEWTIMQHCWKLGRATARQIYEASDGSRDYRTIKTFLDRIADKGFLRIEKLGRLSLYVPAVARQRAVSDVVARFVDKVLERSVTPLYLHLAERDDLSPEEIVFFRQQLEREEKP